MNPPRSESSVFVPGKGKTAVPFMRDVFTIPANARHRPRLIGSVCEECEEYFFPKTGAKTTCDSPVCPRSTGEALLSGKGRLLSATITHSTAPGESERVSAVILLEEGIKINSHLLGWEGYRDMLAPGAPVELVLQDLGENEWRETQVGYAFRLVTGRKRPAFPPTAEEARARKKKRTPAGARTRKKPAASASKAAGTRKQAAAAAAKTASAGAKAASSGSSRTSSAGKAAAPKKATAKAAASAKKKAPLKKEAASAKKPPASRAGRRKAASRSAPKRG